MEESNERVISCASCGEDISVTARRCPHCNQKVTTVRWAIGLAVFGVLVAAGFTVGNYTGHVIAYWEAGAIAGLFLVFMGVRLYRSRKKRLADARSPR